MILPASQRRLLWVWSVILAVTMALGLVLVASPRQADAAGPFVQDLGRAEDNAVVPDMNGDAPVTLTTTATVKADDSIVVVASFGGSGPTATCSDSVNNTYSVDVLSTASGARSAICSAHNVHALPAGAQITVTWNVSFGVPAFSARVIALEFTGLVSPYVDTSADTGPTLLNGSTMATGFTPTTTQPRELLVGTFFTAGTTTTAGFAPGTNGTANACVETGSPTFVAQPGVGATATSTYVEYCTVTAVGSYRAQATRAGANNYSGALATYRFESPPALTTTGSALSYTENSGAVAVDPSLTVTDPDNTTLSGASVAITGGFVGAEDALAFTSQGGIAGAYNAATGILTLTGTASVATYQAALRSATYTNSGRNPTSATRTVTFLATDSIGQISSDATRQISVISVDDAPVNTVPGTQTTLVNTPLVFTAGLGNAFGISDLDIGSGNLQATLAVTSGTLVLGGTDGLIVTGNGTSTVSATGPLLNLNAALQGLTFAPRTGFSGTVTLTLTANDQGNTGTGGPLQRQSTVQINVSAAPTPTPTVAPPPVVLSVTKAGANRLQVEVAAPSTLRTVAWTPAHSFSVEDANGTLVTGGVLTVPIGTTRAVFYVHRLSGTSVTVPLTLTGAFGTWQTFVGGGPAAWQ